MDQSTNLFQFELPGELIAQEPPPARGDSRLLLVEPDKGVVAEREFRGIVGCLDPGDLLVLNQSEVLPARLQTVRADTGGQVEILLIRPVPETGWLAMARPARRLRSGQKLKVVGGPWLTAGEPIGEEPLIEIIDKLDDGNILVSCDVDPGVVAKKWGVMPLPPYISQDLTAADACQQDARDRERYQTVFAQGDVSGAASVAAPTAGLHFSPTTLDRLQERGVRLARLTLHVGPGTFRPPTPQQINDRRLHREFFHLPGEVSAAIAATRKNGGRVIAVGTTSLRVLETVARLGLDQPGSSVRGFGPDETDPDPVFTGEAIQQAGHWEVTGQTRLFISPPEQIGAADGLLTNFHLPGSSLLMLVARSLRTRRA